MSKESGSNKFNNKSDIERYLKSDKNFMNSHSAAEFDAYVEGALWMINVKRVVIDNLTEKTKNYYKKIIELDNELAPYKELYEDYDFVEKRTKKSKKKVVVNDEESDDFEPSDDIDYSCDMFNEERIDDFDEEDDKEDY